MPSWINIPNLLTALRLLLLPFILEAILEGHHTLALALFGAAAVTDVIDGAVARRYKLTTQAGAYLDPIADKCLLSGVFLALAAAGLAPWWLVLLILGRDVYILVGVALAMRFSQARKFPPSVWGKASTFIQILTAVAWMVRNAYRSGLTELVSSALVWPCAAITLWSGAHYTWRALRPNVRIDAVSARE